MSFKNISFLSVMLAISYAQSNAHEAKRPSLQCTGKVATERQPLFVQAEQHEHNFIITRAQCLQANDCDTNFAFEQAKYNVVYSIVTLLSHLQELEKGKDGVCNVCEKNEAKDIKNRLTQLLKSAQ